MESSHLNVAHLDSSHSASIAREKEDKKEGISIVQSLGYLPVVEQKLDKASSSAFTPISLAASTAQVPSDISGAASLHGQEIGYNPLPDKYVNIPKAEMQYEVVNVVEETRKAMEQVGAQNSVVDFEFKFIMYI